MLTMVFSAVLGAALAIGLVFGDAAGWGWCAFWGVLAFAAAQISTGIALQRRVKARMLEVQGVLARGQKHLQMKIERWQRRPMDPRAAQREVERDQRMMVREALALIEPLHRFDLWVPLMKRQIATAQFQLNWSVKDFEKCDELMPLALFLDPNSCSMKLARLHATNAPTEEIAKFYRKAVRRARYNDNVLPAATWSWILLRRGDADGAFKALNEALRKSDNPVLKANRDALANNRTAHFTNAGLGEQWYALFLEEPRNSQPRQRMQWK